jgi:hypothetical protein
MQMSKSNVSHPGMCRSNSAAWPILLLYNVFVCQHFLGFKRVELITPRLLLNANPVFHDCGKRFVMKLLKRRKRHSTFFLNRRPTTLSPNFQISRMPKASLTLHNFILLNVTSKETPRNTEKLQPAYFRSRWPKRTPY